jgi:hypothetical protein
MVESVTMSLALGIIAAVIAVTVLVRAVRRMRARRARAAATSEGSRRDPGRWRKAG